MPFTDLCPDCNGRGKTNVMQNGNVVEIFCATCDGTGTLEEHEAFQKKPSRRKKDFDEEDE